jgi:Flp pilus assembly protein TadD
MAVSEQKPSDRAKQRKTENAPSPPPGRRPAKRILLSLLATLVLIAAILSFVLPKAFRERLLESQSIENLRQMDSRDDADALVHLVYAERLMHSGASADAWPSVQHAASTLSPSDTSELAARTWALAGYLAARYGSTREAETWLQAADGLHAQEGMVALGKGALAIRRQQAADAVTALTRAAELEPTRAEVWSQLGAAYLLAAEAEQAVDAFRHAVQLAPNDPQTHAELAEGLGRLKQYDAAFAECRAAADLAPEDSRFSTLPTISRASSARTDAEYAQADRMLEEMMHRFPNVDFLHALRSGLHMRFNRYDPARREMEAYLTHHPKDADGWINLGLICERNGDALAAVKAREKAQQIMDLETQSVELKRQSLLHPDDADLLVRLSAALQRTGKIRESVAALVHASELKPNDPEIARTLAAVQTYLNQVESSAAHDNSGNLPQ